MQSPGIDGEALPFKAAFLSKYKVAPRKFRVRKTTLIDRARPLAIARHGTQSMSARRAAEMYLSQYDASSPNAYYRRGAQPMIWQTRSPTWVDEDDFQPPQPSPRPPPPQQQAQPAPRRMLSPTRQPMRREVHVPARGRSRRPNYAAELGAEFLHAWEQKDVERWLYAAGLDDMVQAFKTAELKGEHLLDMNASNAGDQLKDVDDAGLLRLCAALQPLKQVWKHSRQAAGLSLKPHAKPPPPEPPKPPPPPKRARPLVAELHVLVDGASHLPPGASGAYVEVEVTPKHKLKSAFLPAPASTYYEAGHSAHSPYAVIESAHPHLASYSLPHEPQAFRISIDDKMKAAIEAQPMRVSVIAWVPRKGELEVGRVEIPLPDPANGTVQVLRLDRPVRAEFQWVLYHATAAKTVGDWQPVPTEEQPRLAPLVGAWYTPCDDLRGSTHGLPYQPLGYS